MKSHREANRYYRLSGTNFPFLWALGASIVLLRLLRGKPDNSASCRRRSTLVEGSDWADIVDDLKATFSLKRPVTLRIATADDSTHDLGDFQATSSCFPTRQANGR